MAEALTGGDLPSLEPSWEVASIADAPIYLSTALLGVADPDIAWRGIVDLHHQAIDGSIDGSIAADLSSQDAFEQWSNGIAGVLGQLASTNHVAGNKILGSISEFAEFEGGLDGLESPFLSAYLSAARGGDITPQMRDAQRIVDQFGMPSTLGGGAQTVPILNPEARSLGLADAASIAETVLGVADSRGLQSGLPKLMSHLADGVLAGAHAATPPAHHAQSGSAATITSFIYETASATATGASVGALFGPVGKIVGGIVGAIAAFFSAIFGGSSDDAGQTAQPAREVASGERIVVSPPTVITNTTTTTSTTTTSTTTTTTYNITHTSGTTKHSEQPSHSPPPSETAQRICPVPSPQKCPVDDDDLLIMIEDFRLTFWEDSAIMLPTVTPTGPGTDYLLTAGDNAVLQLEEMPTVNESAQIVQPGLLIEAINEELLYDFPKVAVPTDPGPGAKTVDPTAVDPAVLRAQDTVVKIIQEVGIAPHATIAELRTVLRAERSRRVNAT